MNDPISAVEWREASTLNANDYKSKLCSPRSCGCSSDHSVDRLVQPILVTKDGTIIDGFHRVRLAIESAALRKHYAGKVPCAVIDLPRDKTMVLTIRMNRAKGRTHVAVRMSWWIGALANGAVRLARNY
jgi:ParB-like nuclease domain